MVFSKNTKILVYIFFIISLISFGYSQFPQFDFTEEQYPSGSVTISALASSGTQVSLFVNENFIGKLDIIAPSKTVFLENSIQNEIIPIGANLIFKNNNPSKIYKLNITNYQYKKLNFAQTLTFNSYNEGDILYKDFEEGITKKITVVDELANITFPNAQNYLLDGENKLRFVLTYPLSTLATTDTFEYMVNYEKYSNLITLTNFSNITNKREIKISGAVSDSQSPLYYVLNYEGEITNLGVLKSISLNGNKFNLTIPNLREGENLIRLITTDPSNNNIFNGEKIVKVLSDRTPPTIKISSGFRPFTNQGRLELNISTDAIELNYTFNGQNRSQQVEGENTLLSLSLKKGKNDLTLIAIDIAGNIYKEAHQIELDRTKPDIKKPEKENLFPQELFRKKTAHFFFQKIKGKVNKPEVQMTIFTIPISSIDNAGNKVNCENYERLFLRNLGQLDNSRKIGDDPGLNMNESQISLLSLINKKKTLTTKDDGSFNAIITFQEKNFDRGDFNNMKNPKTPPKVGSVKSRNRICFVMEDKFGNYNSRGYDITLDAGNTMWRPAEITTIPNTLYAAEIEQTGDVRVGTGNIEFGMIARFQYIGPGKVTKLSGLGVSIDTKGAKDSKYAKPDLTRMSWMLDKDTGDLILYFPVKILPLKIKPLDYPDKLDFAFQINRLTYRVDDNTIPIDEANPIYFQTSINLERPLDHTKWLTPQTIEKLQGFLNQTITFTKKFTEYMGFASVGGVLACTGTNMYYSGRIAFEKDKKIKEDYQKNIFMVCDRVMGMPSPQDCEGRLDELTTENSFKLEKKIKEKNTYTGVDLADAPPILNKDNNKLSNIRELKIGRSCNFDGTDPKKIDGRFVSGYEEIIDKGGFITPNSITKKPFRNKCARYDETERLISFSSFSSACFSKEAPKFDQTKCNFFTLDGDDGLPGWNSKDNIIESIRCGVITDTYSHSKNLLKIQEQIYKCLEQAKLGEVKGGYCERLLSQAVCDVATNILFKTIQQTSSSSSETEDSREPGIFKTLLEGASQGDKRLNERYGPSSIFSQAGLGSQGIVNKVCLGALTGDWSVLTDNLLNAIDKNQVKPTFGPMFPTSRFQNYNPFDGTLSVQYRLTYGAVSGGQRISSKVEFFCDRSQNGGEYCPDGGRKSAKELRAKITQPIRLYTPKGGFEQKNIVVTDTKARYRYNIACITHKYNLGDKQITTDPVCDNIFAKGDLFANCHWDGGLFGVGIADQSNLFGEEFSKGGLTCDKIFSDSSSISLYNFGEGTKLVPTDSRGKTTLYSGNNVLIDAVLDLRPDANSGSMDNLKIIHYLSCNGNDNPIKETTVNVNKGFRQLIKLDKIPQLGIKTDKTLATTTLQLTNGMKIGELKLSIPTSTNNNNEQKITRNFNILGFIVNGKSIDKSISVQFNNDNKFELNGNILNDLNKLITDTKNEIIIKLDKEVKGVTFTAFEVKELEYNNNLKSQLDGECGDSKRLDDKCKKDLIKIYDKNPYKLPQSGGDKVDFGSVIKQSDREKTKLEINSAGTCKLNMRLVPIDTPRPTTVEEFKNYNSYGDNLITSKGLKDEPFELTFNIGRNTKQNERQNIQFNILNPSKSKTICVGTEGKPFTKNIPIIVPFVSSYDGFIYKDNNERLSTKISFSRQQIGDNNKIIDKFIWNEDGYYKSKLQLKEYTLPKGSDFEDVTLYLTYTPKDESKINKPKTISSKFSFRKCKDNFFDSVIKKGQETLKSNPSSSTS